MKVRFYLTSSGRSPVEEFLQGQSLQIRTTFVESVALLADGTQLDMPTSRNLSNIHPGLRELRLKDRSGQIRVFYFIKKGDAIYLLHAFQKKTQALPRNEIETALRRLKEV